MKTMRLEPSLTRAVYHQSLRHLWEIRTGGDLCLHDMRARHILLKKWVGDSRGKKWLPVDKLPNGPVANALVTPGTIIDVIRPDLVQPVGRIGTELLGFETVEALVERPDGLQVMMKVFVGEYLSIVRPADAISRP